MFSSPSERQSLDVREHAEVLYSKPVPARHLIIPVSKYWHTEKSVIIGDKCISIMLILSIGLSVRSRPERSKQMGKI